MSIKDRKEREKQQKHDHILNVAETIFFEKGYENATMEEIAEKAEYSKGTLYLYFKNKEELYIFIAGRAAELLYSILENYMNNAQTGELKLNAIKRAYLTMYSDHHDYCKILFQMSRYAPILQSIKENSSIQAALAQKQQKLQALIVGAIELASREGFMPDQGPQSQEEKMITFFAGGTILEGIMKHVLDIEDLLKQQYKVNPLILIEAAFQLLRF